MPDAVLLSEQAPAQVPHDSCVAMFLYANSVINWDMIGPIDSEAGHYGDIGYPLMEAWSHAAQLGMISAKKKLRTLDLGTGAGCLPFVLRYLGHDAHAIDLPNPGDHHATKREALGVPYIQHRISAGKPLPAPEVKYDLITAFRVQFARRSSGPMPLAWSVPEWSYFLDDIRDNQLAEGGRLVMGPRLRRDPLRLPLFEERGGRFLDPNEEMQGKKKILIFDPLL